MLYTTDSARRRTSGSLVLICYPLAYIYSLDGTSAPYASLMVSLTSRIHVNINRQPCVLHPLVQRLMVEGLDVGGYVYVGREWIPRGALCI